MSVIVRVQFEGVTYDLDIDSGIPLRLDVSAVENTRIGQFFGVGSQKFVLPGTKTNNQFFKHAYQVGAEDVPAFYESIEGQIIFNGETLLQGQFQLLDVTADDKGYVSYNCQISDSVVQFKDAIANKLVSQADWSAYTHILSKDNIVASWSNNLLGGSVYYPMADYGQDSTSEKDFPNTPRIQLGAGNIGDINSPLSPMRVKQFLPAIKVKDVLTVLLDQVNYRATGSFIETEYFNNLYVLPKSQEGLGITGETGNANTFNAGYYASPLQTLGPVFANSITSASMQAINETSDPGNNYNAVAGVYTAPISGDYQFAAQIAFFNPASEYIATNITLQLEKVSGGVTTVIDPKSVFTAFYSPSGPYNLSSGQTLSLQTGDQIRAKIILEGQGSPFEYSNTLTIQQFNSYFRCTSAPIVYEGATVNMATQFEASTKSIDVIKGLIEQFNLILIPEYGTKNAIRIESFDDWIFEGRDVDWTDKYDTATRISINHTVDEQQRELKLGNVVDNDRISKLSVESAPNFQYGTLRILSDSNIPQGERTIGSFFSPTVLANQITSGSVDLQGNPTFNFNNGSNIFWPHLYKFENNKQTAFKFKPRLGYKVDVDLVPGDIIYIGLPGAYNAVSGSYSTISNLYTLPAVENVTPDLHFNNTYTPLIASSNNPNSGQNNYERYWKNYIDSLYWDGSRKVTLDVEFNQDEYKDIRLNDRIFIKDQIYRINKIQGFNLSQNDVSTVELLRLFPAYYTREAALDCSFNVTGTYSSGSCGPTPTPTATPTPTPTPAGQTPTPTPVGPTPTPTPTPTAQPTCIQYNLFAGGSSTLTRWDYTCCGGSPGSTILEDYETATVCAQLGTFNPVFGPGTYTTGGTCFIVC